MRTALPAKRTVPTVWQVLIAARDLQAAIGRHCPLTMLIDGTWRERYEVFAAADEIMAVYAGGEIAASASGYDDVTDVAGRLERVASQITPHPGDSRLWTGGPSGSTYVPPEADRALVPVQS